MSAEKATADTTMEAELKIILLGDSAVGKTKLVERYLMDNYEPQQLSTYALTVFRHNTEIDGKPVSIDFWDTAGQERFTSMHPSYYYRAHACILAFDVTRKVTYQNMNAWYKELRQYRPKIPVIVVANKIDSDYKVTEKTFAFATKRKLPFFFCSASDGTNVVTVFKEAIKAAMEFKSLPSGDFMDDVLETVAYFDAKSKGRHAASASGKGEDNDDDIEITA
ncbi:Ras family [Plasmodiophora brassicae]|uniref:Uncharacterized protein n=1 Tax=Plasmodiophora brassicae TaxID=37360 RepID=A0A0G4ISR4_PLABS|nr:hypothetical protein PBRA_006517 [Plasmodiophora brassicae]SPQ94487.1 unnamed protein product [Plasmodiophora brassicae]